MGSHLKKPQSFFQTLSIVLHSRSPMFLCWGPEYILFYNDAYRPFLERYGIHPVALGRPAGQVWPEVWSAIKPLVDQVLSSGEGTSNDHKLLPVYKNGQREERVWNFSYNPVYDESGRPAGVLGTCNETRVEIQHLGHEYERYKRILDSLTATMAILDRQGNIITYNEAWNTFGKENGAAGGEIEENYLEICRTTHETEGLQIAEGIEKVLSGELDIFNLDYPRGTSKEERWFRARISPLNIGETITEVVISYQDISERKRVEQLSQKALHEKQKILDASLDVICSFDVDARFIQVSKACREVWGYEPEELLGIGYLDLVHPDDHAKTIAIASRIGAGEEIRNFENRYLRKDGSIVPMVWSARQDMEEDVMYCIARDATEKKEAERQSVAYTTKIRKILESITDGFFTLNQEWEVISWNREAERLLGFSKEEIIGKNFWQVYEEAQFLQFYTEYHRAVTDQVSVHFVEYLPSRDAWFDVSGYPTEDGLLVFFKDITLRKRVDEQIRIAKERYDLMAKATHDAIWDWDLSTNEIRWGDGYRTLFGYDVKDEITTSDSWSGHIHPDDISYVTKGIDRTLFSPEAVQWKDVYRFIKADGTYATVLDRGFVIRYHDGTPLRMIGAMQDITVQKVREQEMEQLIRELTQTNFDLRQFSFITSHNFRAPLCNLLGLLDLMEDIPITEPALQEIMKGFKSSTVALNETINDLNNILMIKERPSKEKENIRIGEVFEKIYNQILIPINEAEAEIEFDDQEVSMVYFNRPCLESIFMNLLTNAIKYRSFARKLKVQIHTQVVGDSVLLLFQDNGIGLDVQRYQSRLFGLYQRFHDRPDSKGLGLYLIKSQIITLGGEIEINSQVDLGTTFKITFTNS
ncbi:PAS domain S-box protein [Telluribacter sp.]|uniref:PAS domain-containing sensor histidine kinase n=1 Tax=Telluribacter sp. TaxID=1978767 RepID=UPI002E0E0F23|nr:PAS domain S-box protein [Telluribacter sp.]